MKAHNILYVTSHSAYTVVRAERGRQNSETPEPIDRKLKITISPVCQNSKRHPTGPSRHIGEYITVTWFLVFFLFVTSNLGHLQRPNCRTDFLCFLIRRTSIPGYCIPRRMKLLNVYVYPYFTPKIATRRGINRHFAGQTRIAKHCPWHI